MGKIKTQAIKLAITTQEQVDKLVAAQLAITKHNDRPLEELEITYEAGAEQLSIIRYPRIHPMKATIGYLVRSMEGRNHQAIEFLRATLVTFSGSTAPKTSLIVKEFDNLDINSQNRVDCLDILCRKYSVPPIKFLESIKMGIVEYHNSMTSILIAERKPELAAKIFDMANKADKVADRRLAAEVSGLTNKEPLVNVNTGKTVNNNQTNVVLSFSEFVKANDKSVRGQKLIEESKDFVEGEVIE